MALNITLFKQRLLLALPMVDTKAADRLKERIAELEKAHVGSQEWNRYRNFWPPTPIKALRENRLIAFMGAGTSAASGLPTWRDLLENRFGVPKEFLADENLKNDNLTLGEIASRLIGRDTLQANLRGIYNKSHIAPTTIHACLAALELPVYITTNYDTLLEKIWKEMYGSPLAVICNSSDAKRFASLPNKLYKIHGSASRLDELLVLSRSDYRQHYRSNPEMFDELKKLIQEHPTVFTGFSHTDPEIGRLIDDVIFRFEHDALHKRPAVSPDFYNMQFENTYVTNERFAAKGMVSLNVRLDDAVDVDARTSGAAIAIAELVDAMASRMDEITSLDEILQKVLEPIRASLEAAIDELKAHRDAIADTILRRPVDKAQLEAILLGVNLQTALGTQGLYLLDASGDVLARLYDGLDEAARDKELQDRRNNLAERSYFQKSKSFRRPFVSDFFPSIFNNNSTFAICVPIVRGDTFLGLLYTACQIGQWCVPVDAAKGAGPGIGTYVLDGQGIVAFPPRTEFLTRLSPLMASERDAVRIGFDFVELKILSKKDRIISRLAENIVPVEKDDDVLSLDKDLEIYARIQNISDLGWRCAISRTIKFSH